MTSLHKKQRYYNQLEAANLLGISVAALYEILDKNVFSRDHLRPDDLEFTHSELLLLSVWAKPERVSNILEMPVRN